MDRSSILILSGVRGDTRRYRTFHLYQQLRMAGVDCVLSHLTDPALPLYAKNARAIILHRVPEDTYIRRIEDQVRQRGGRVLVDTDDLTFEPEAFQWIDSPDFQDPVRRSLYKEEMRLQNQTMLACDAVLASTEFLAARVRGMGKACWVHRNAASLELVYFSEQARQQRSRTDGRILIGYASGTPTHNQDFASITPALQATLKAHPQVELWIIGPVELSKTWFNFSDRVHCFPAVPWRDLPSRLANLDINLAPLAEDNPFSQSKSEIKYMEAAFVSVPTIASRTDAFGFAIRNGENGYLASGIEEWTAALEALIDAKKRREMAREACEDVYRGYTPSVRALEGIRTLNEIGALATQAAGLLGSLETQDTRQHWVDANEERQPTMSRMFRYSLSHRGLPTALKQLWIYFRRGLARYIPYR